MKTLQRSVRNIKVAALVIGGAIIALTGGVNSVPARAAACQAPGTDYGQVSSSVTVPGTATYRVWTRMMPADQTNKSFLLEVDGTQCFTVTSNAGAGNWEWVDYQGGTSTSKMNMSLSQGNHTVKLIGTQPGVKVDRVLFVSDQTCVPTGFGDNCNVPDDATPPTVSLSAPQENATVSGTTTITASAQDNIGVSKVELYVNSQLIATKTSAPYSTSWNTTNYADGPQTLIAKAYDAAGNTSSDSYSVTVQNGTGTGGGGTGGGGTGTTDTQAPTAPSGVTATAATYNNVQVKWSASTDNVGVAGYFVYRNNAVLAKVSNTTSYTDTTALPNTRYSYIIAGYDAAGNEGENSSAAVVTTPGTTNADTQAPTAPSKLTAVAATSNQINLSWQASSDNVGVAAYDIYRSTGTGSAQKVASVTTTSYGDTTVAANQKYSYYVVARDAAGNKSKNSNTVSATTPKATRTSRIMGTVSQTTNAISGARVVMEVGGVKYTTTTDQQGHYTIRDVPQGRYNITYSATGHYSKTIQVLVTDTTITKNVHLQHK